MVYNASDEAESDGRIISGFVHMVVPGPRIITLSDGGSPVPQWRNKPAHCTWPRAESQRDTLEA